ncbi:UDP-N-acetylglucosamine 1-carboxyvinyltransferase [Microbacterium thalassium]|uniref:UDP-N-acetylglucosamine 1-carboxyvinyltransferase n=1 Tax=Microbacterium thalassium TaxID=362649 RepID=A0A7X0FPG9_9MICO|nr:UDP-N-acetylglucosamine 1-carboxyvinyltransferase [Microbacterium thalassium]MBB6391303.1 UDP-N-acetylglucosamine 1-carboxyvinyltransferase [Microbacterium thalassium]GLK23585.1 UDP-N-acetylglucosamine 1-carboxyvinyltransferase [Microbacterium thalassium]
MSKSSLNGRVSVAGAKNSALRLLAASILTDAPVHLTNYPSGLLDAQIHVGMLEALGKSVQPTGIDSVRITQVAPLTTRLVWPGRSIRNTLLILGALTARYGAAAVPLPGGCRLGERQYDIHVSLLEQLGARVWDDESYLYAEAPNGLVGTDVHLRLRSTGATENAILAATLAKGATRVWNPHIRPEVLDLVSMLNAMGAKIVVHGQEHIEIEGVEALHEVDYAVMPDNMEALTWLIAASVTGGEVEIVDFPVRDLEVILAHLRSAGATYVERNGSLVVRGEHCYPFEISTGPHPGINSDVQPVMAAWAARARGESRIIDLRFPGRYGYADELAKMGVTSRVDGEWLLIDGADGKLTGASVRALDLRAGAALAICGLMAEGETTVTDAWQISRGYVDFAEKLRSLGGNAEWL